MRFAALILLFLSLALAPAAADVPFQRMVLAPGCYVLGPHSFTDVSAFCLDEELPAPGHGVALASVPDALGDTFLTVNGKKEPPSSVNTQGGAPVTLSFAPTDQTS